MSLFLSLILTRCRFGSILPQKRIVAYYGNPLSKKMGALGEFQKDEMLKRLKGEVAKWEKADPSMSVQPAPRTSRPIKTWACSGIPAR